MNTLVKAAIGCIAATAALGGCASSPDRPLQQFARAETSIKNAEQNGAREYASVELDRARDKLARAERAADRNENGSALRLAQQAALDAELAGAKASRGKSEESLREVQENIEALRRETARSETN